MVFKFATFDPRQDPDDFNPAFPPPPSSSSSATLCQTCEHTYTFTKAIVSQLVAAGASLVCTAPACASDDREIQDKSAETQFNSISSYLRPEFHQGLVTEFTLKELEAATQKFSNKKVIGSGGFGKVYEGQIADGSLAAIKRLKERTPAGIEQFKMEVRIGCFLPPHSNLLPLLGICRASECEELLVVYPLMINKSAALWLRGRPETQPPLDWPTRIKIAVGAARGLSHLHFLTIVHRDIKAANIMLDEDFEPRIGDFGLAKVIDNCCGSRVDCPTEAPIPPWRRSHNYYCGVTTTAVRGTIGHIAPEYLSSGKCSFKSDVFAFGITLLELVTGQKAFDIARLANEDDAMLLDWVKERMQPGRIETLADPDMRREFDRAEIEKTLKLALLCTQSDPAERPHMAEVVQIIEGLSIEERSEWYCRSKKSGDFSSPPPTPEELSGPR